MVNPTAIVEANISSAVSVKPVVFKVRYDAKLTWLNKFLIAIGLRQPGISLSEIETGGNINVVQTVRQSINWLSYEDVGITRIHYGPGIVRCLYDSSMDKNWNISITIEDVSH